MKDGFIFWILLLWATISHAQELLFHKKSYREVFYKKSEEISFQVKGSHAKKTGTIAGFEGDSVIVFEGFKVRLDSITHLYMDRKTKSWYVFRYKYAKVLPIVGIGWLLIDLLNRGIVTPHTMKFTGTMVFLGLLAKIVVPQKITLKGQRKLIIVH